ncbi:MAG: trimethylamine methyltransferase family protein, partial [Pseudomonadota bacterium]
MNEQPKRRRGGGRSGNVRRGGAAIDQIDWHIPAVSDAPTEPLTNEGVAAIHEAAMSILEDIGIDFLHEGARNRLKAAGADVRDGEERVRMGRDMVMEYVAKAPAEFTLTPRNPAKALTIGGNRQVYVNVSSPPSC